MESFEDLGLGPELVEALSSEGMEEPTPFQAAAIPVIRRGNNLLGRAGPGAGTLVAYGSALLARLEPGAGTPRALVVAPSADSARRLAECIAGLAAATGHAVAAAGSPWVLPERADILFGTATDLVAWARANRFDPNAVEALVLDQAAAQQRMGGLGDVEALLAFLPKEGQRIVLALPLSAEIEDFVERHVRRAMSIPPRAVGPATAAPPQRGEVRYRIVEEPREAGALQLVAELLEDARHCCLFFATEDGAADVGDYLTLHGYAAGAPGEEAAPVWLAVRELDARAALADGVVPVSYDAPTGPDSLDRRHGGGRGGVIITLPREMPHLRDVARTTGYRVVPFPPPVPSAGRGELDALLAKLEAAAGDTDLAPYLIALEPIFARKGAAEVAAAAVALLRQRAPAPSKEAPAPAAPKHETARAAPPAHRAEAVRAPAAPPGAFARLYISLGERDDARPGDVMGAITGESGIAGSQIGKIDIRDTFSIVEVEESVADRVIRALNGVTVRGRAVRVDYDRARPGGREARGPASGPRGPKGARGERAPERAGRGAARGGGRERTPQRGSPRGGSEGRGEGRGERRGEGRERHGRDGAAGRRGPQKRREGPPKEGRGPRRGGSEREGPPRPRRPPRRDPPE
jgi:ATP-dependent RNA helicase DeaD